MGEKIFWAIIGALVMRYIILHTPDYQQKEAAKLDEIRNTTHDLIKKFNPSADDSEVGQAVLSAYPDSN
jgi:hypothetical protein